MIQKLKSMKANKKGFTLAELLIVVAILAVLAAIAVPTFSAQLEKAREQVDSADLRSAVSLAQADFLTNKYAEDKEYYFDRTPIEGDKSQAMVIAKTGTGDFHGETKDHKTMVIKVEINADSSIKSAAWIKPGSST